MRRNLQNLQINNPHRSIVLGFPIGDLGMSDCFAVCLSSLTDLLSLCLLCLPAAMLRRSAHLHAYLLLSAWLAAFRSSTILSSSAIRPRTDILTQ